MSAWTETPRQWPHRLWLCDCGAHVFCLSNVDALRYGFGEIIGSYHDRGLVQRLRDAWGVLRGHHCTDSFVIADAAQAREIGAAFGDLANRLEVFERTNGGVR